MKEKNVVFQAGMSCLLAALLSGCVGWVSTHLFPGWPWWGYGIVVLVAYCLFWIVLFLTYDPD